MGADKRPGYGVVGVVLVMTAVVIAGWRYLGWRKQWQELKAGQIVQVTELVSGEISSQWGKRFVEVGPGRLIRVEIPGGKTVNSGDKLIVIGEVKERVIGGKSSGFRMIPSDFQLVSASNWQKWITGIREGLIRRVENWLPGDEGGLAAGILLGGSSGLSEKASENFRKTGLAHIVAASGYNVTVVAGWVIAMGVKIAGKKRSIYFGIVSIILYVFLAGGNAAVVRAGIMASLVLVGLSLGRKTETVWAWLITGLGMIIVSPGYLEDVGWQLSMAATGGLVVLIRGGEERLLVADLKTTLAAQVATLPILLHYFGNMSVIAPLTNIVVLWTIPPVMQIMAMATLAGLVWDSAGRWLSWLAWPLLRWMTGVTEVTGNLQWSSWIVGEIGWRWVAGYYILLVIISNFKFLITKKHL
jgi:ComEC/Rec2-related protein